MKYILKSSFHQRVGKLEDVKIIKQNGTFSLQVVFKKVQRGLTKSFNLGNNTEHYVLPSLKSSTN